MIPLWSLSAFAQTPTHAKSIVMPYDSTSTIVGSSGRVVPYSEWGPFTETDRYFIRQTRNNSGRDEFMLIHLSREKQQEIAIKSPPGPSPNFHIGDTLILNGKNLGGRIYSKATLKNKIIVIHIWLSLDFHPIQLSCYNELVDSFGNNKRIIFLSLLEDNEATARELFKDYPFKYSIVPGQQKLLKKWSVRSYPKDVILNDEGIVIYSSIGFGVSTIYWLRKKINESIKQLGVS
ncbi:MAG: hypothetical protein Q8927_10860 [Bacteroidota bacterium]|nr:hypothetical protein [Bacteroidota bacterium]MDP4216690.1 hypothetical protein [Bacteroidota bacterium]MDP4244206.1 hypothetical protein [Bacteroidota bacterium]MDP4258865.1 hypothetical protein [Bacteroidota bacterium]